MVRIEEIDRLLFNSLMEMDDNPQPHMLKQKYEEIIDLIRVHSNDQYDEGHSQGYEDGREDMYWEVEEAREFGYADGYADAKEKFESIDD